MAVVIGISVIALGAGVLIGWAIFGGGSGGDEDDRAATNVATACEILERLEDEFPLEADDASPLGDPVTWEISGAGQLMGAAELADDEYEEWREVGIELITAVQIADFERLDDSFDAAIEMCADR